MKLLQLEPMYTDTEKNKRKKGLCIILHSLPVHFIIIHPSL